MLCLSLAWMWIDRETGHRNYPAKVPFIFRKLADCSISFINCYQLFDVFLVIPVSLFETYRSLYGLFILKKIPLAECPSHNLHSHIWCFNAQFNVNIVCVDTNIHTSMFVVSLLSSLRKLIGVYSSCRKTSAAILPVAFTVRVNPFSILILSTMLKVAKNSVFFQT